jgi:hypothetical protein
VEISKSFTIESTDYDYDEFAVVDLADELAKAGVLPDDIDTVFVQNVSITVDENNTPANTTTTGEVTFGGAGETPLLLASFDELNLDLNEGRVINAFNAIAEFTLNGAGISSLRTRLFLSPPPVLYFYLTGTVNQIPVDFTITLTVTYQLKANL